jgi:16S rRNA processing protein RimM
VRMMTRQLNRVMKSGSPVKGEPEYILIGKLQRTHGVTGEIVFGVQTDFPERVKAGKTVYLGNNHYPKRITGTRPFHNNLLIIFENIKNREEAAELTNLEVFVLTKDLPALENGQYYHHQLIGLNAVLEDGTSIGTIRDILVTGANDVYVVVNPEGIETLLPAVESVILDIDLETGSMKVKPPEWE